MAVTDHSVTSRTIAQHIESVTHHSVYARTIRRHLQQSGLSARRSMLGLPLTQNHRRLRANGAMKKGCGWQNGMKLSLLTSHASVCNTTMVGFESGDTVGRGMLNSCVMHRHTGPAPGIMVWDGIGYHSRTPLDLTTAIFQQDNARPPVARIIQRFFVNQQIELLPWLACSPDLSPIENMWSMVAQRL
ncbi:transposable element Tcb1 transposase [Trichonephila clavipes]|nr:transposable element Tcb1 transposase [Trichonephila clavipes]